MRGFFLRTVLTIATLGVASAAFAADLDYGVLRGPEDEYVAPTVDWSGFYIGAHGGYGSGAFGFGTTAHDIVANALRYTTIETEHNVSGFLDPRDVRKGGLTFGGFAGYNVQFENVVFGLEVDYTSANIAGSSGDAIGRRFDTADGFHNIVNLVASTQTKIRDFGTFRARAGYAFDNFLPYVTGGFAIGRAKIADTVGIQAYGYNVGNNQSYGYSFFDPTDPSNGVPAPMEFFSRAKTKTVGGVALGGGLEYALTPSILLRGEYQYVLFNDFDGHKLNLNTVRGGAAVKF